MTQEWALVEVQAGPTRQGRACTSAPRMCSGAMPVVFRMRQNQFDGLEYTWPVALQRGNSWVLASRDGAVSQRRS